VPPDSRPPGWCDTRPSGGRRGRGQGRGADWKGWEPASPRRQAACRFHVVRQRTPLLALAAKLAGPLSVEPQGRAMSSPSGLARSSRSTVACALGCGVVSGSTRESSSWEARKRPRHPRAWRRTVAHRSSGVAHLWAAGNGVAGGGVARTGEGGSEIQRALTGPGFLKE